MSSNTWYIKIGDRRFPVVNMSKKFYTIVMPDGNLALVGRETHDRGLKVIFWQGPKSTEKEMKDRKEKYKDFCRS